MKQWFEQPSQVILYSVEFQGKKYEIQEEVMFALIMNEFKKRIEKENIIEQTNVEIPSNDHHICERIRTSLESIGFSNVLVNPFVCDYKSQGEQLIEIMEKKEKIDMQKRKIERAKEINPSAIKKLREIDLESKEISQDDNFELELSKKFSTKERNEMKLCQLDNYCLFIASRFLESLDDLGQNYPGN